jgi:hypothetical protein
MEAFLRVLLPSVLPEETTFVLHTYQGKYDLIRKLPSRLRGYSNWLPSTQRVLVLVDRDDDDAEQLKALLESIAEVAGLTTKTAASGGSWQAANRIAIEELEAWYFGDWAAVQAAYPRVNSSIPNKAAFRDSDRIAGGTWEAFERVLQAAGYFKEGLRKVEAAQEIAAHFDVSRCTSGSFTQLRLALESATV